MNLYFNPVTILGNLVDWWEPETKQKYLEKAQCIIDQYGNYTVEVIFELEEETRRVILKLFLG